jgi:hypothetical protein
MLNSSLIPYNFFDDLYRGITKPGLVYTERMTLLASGQQSGSRFLNILLLFISFTKLLFIFYFVYYFNNLSKFQKFLCYFYSFFFLSSGLSSGTNSVIFIFFIFFIFSKFVVSYLFDKKLFKRYFYFSSLFALLPVFSFGFIMSRRGGGFEYFSTTSPLGDISVLFTTIDSHGFFGFLLYSLVWLNYYLVQGYYGFSLILNESFDWTFGFGNSAFLQRQFEIITGESISDLTFQHKVSDIWHVDAQWHSFYGQLANDTGLLGVGVFMFFLGFFLCKVWLTILFSKSFYGAALLPIFVILIIFIPANNQVFGYIDTLSYFIFVSILWFFERKRFKF